jgi:hypothetical protein
MKTRRIIQDPKRYPVLTAKFRRRTFHYEPSYSYDDDDMSTQHLEHLRNELSEVFVYGPRSNGQENPCFHSKYTCQPALLQYVDNLDSGADLELHDRDDPDGPLSETQWWNKSVYAERVLSLLGINVSYGRVAYNHFRDICHSFDWASYGDESVKKFHALDLLASNVSLLNFIIELKDLKGTFNTFRSRRSFLRSIASAFELGSLSIAGFITYFGNLVFEYIYGLGAFIRDVSTILTSLDKVVKAYDAALRVPERRYTCLLDKFNLLASFPGVRPVDITDRPVQLEGITTLVSVRHTFSLEYRSCMKYSIQIPFLDGAYGRAKFFLDSFGVNKDPSIIWNAIPFTFVIDWFFDVSAWLHSFRETWTYVDATILGLTHSLRCVQTRTTSVKTLDPLTHGEFIESIIRTEVLVSYARAHHFTQVMPPKSHMIAAKKGFTVRNLIIGALLAKQQWARHHPPEAQLAAGYLALSRLD